jgi:ribose transport system permease protein
MKILAYVLCSTLAAWFSFLYLMQYNSAQPSDTGNFYELYAIAGAVLGGCSLRGGEGMVLGMFIGTCIIRILPNAITMWGIPSNLEFMIIGSALLLGAIMDETLRRGGWQTLALRLRALFSKITVRLRITKQD